MDASSLSSYPDIKITARITPGCFDIYMVSVFYISSVIIFLPLQEARLYNVRIL